LQQYISTKGLLFHVLVILLFYILLFSSLGNNKDNDSILVSENSNGFSQTQRILGIIIILILLFLVIVNVFYFFFNINISTYISDLFTNHPKVDIVVDQDQDTTQPSSPLLSSIKMKKQVYNIPGNYYDYENAKAMCKAYGADLATYEQIEDAYENGGEWCNYGWSSGQMALFPTQQKTFDNLQNIPKHEHDCGRPGINGGFIGNPRVRFGVNCFGYKPKITSEEEEMMQNTTPYPKTEKDVVMEKQVDFWKTKIDDILLSPFNYNSWSRY
jgi:hypothetical protein